MKRHSLKTGCGVSQSKAAVDINIYLLTSSVPPYRIYIAYRRTSFYSCQNSATQGCRYKP